MASVTTRPASVPLDVHVVLEQLERGLIGPHDLLDQQVEAGVGRLELVALVLQLLDPRQDLLGQLLVLCELGLFQLGQDVGLAAQLRDQEPPLVADQGRVDVLVGPAGLAQGIDVQPGLVGKRTVADVGHIHHGREVADLEDEPRDLGQGLDLLRRRAPPGPS